MKHKINTDIIQKILDLSQTKSQKEIAILLDISQSTISGILRLHGIKHKKSRLNMSKLALDINYFESINTKEKAYWLGYVCADGCIHKNSSKVSLISKDREIIEKFKMAIKSEHKLAELNKFDKRTETYNIAYTIQITNELFQKHLIDLGVTSEKTDKLEMPNIPEEYYSYFFAGLFDGDGSLSIYSKIRMSQISTLEILMFLQKYLLNNLNIQSLKLQKVSKNKSNVWKMFLYKDAIKFMNWIYKDPEFSYLSRKYDLYKTI